MVEAGKYHVVVASPPCSTFSRARWANSAGQSLSRVLDHFEVPDASFVRGLAERVPIGVDGEMPRAPAIFDRKSRWALDEVEGTPDFDRAKYKSVEGYEDHVDALFREEAGLGPPVSSHRQAPYCLHGCAEHIGCCGSVAVCWRQRV